MGRGRFLMVAVVVLALAGAGVAQAERKPTKKEHRQVAKRLKFPPRCTRVRISTAVTRPKWASLNWKPGGHCLKFAADGVALLKKRPGKHWKFVTAGSSFDCGPLFARVPQAVVQDFGIGCM